ncbi:MAG: TM2 domain-containing protein [Burkholderiaceae bacterium]
MNLPHRSKTITGALALFFGWAGAHRLYLGGRFWWLYPLFAVPAIALALAVAGEFWYRHPGFYVAVLVTVASMLEAIVIALTPDEKWDAKHNAASGRRSGSGWGAVLVAMAALMLGALLLMSTLAIGLEAWFEALRAART